LKQIVILTPGFPKDESDTACLTYLQNYLLAFKSQYPCIDIKVITLQYPKHATPYSWHSIHVIPLGMSISTLPLKLIKWLKMMSIFRSIHNKRDVDVIHSFWLKDCGLIGHRLSRMFNVRHICTSMGQDVLPHMNRFLQWMPLSKMNIVTVSELQNQHLLNYNSNLNTHVIPWGIQNRDDAVIENRSVDILNVGFLNEGKQLLLFVEAISLIKQSLPDVNVVIVGEDYSKGGLTDKINDLGLRDNISLKGKMPNEEILNYMRRSKVLLHSSRYESFGYVFLEALHAGMMIVSNKVGIAKESKYWLIASDTAESFADKTVLALGVSNDYRSRVPYPVGDTVDLYYNVYRNDS